MNALQQLKKDWFSNVRMDILSGMTVALILIPEAIAFSIIVGVDPKVGLYASFCIALIISFVGGRPGMISAATGSMALVLVTLVSKHGLHYMLAATILTGIIQVLMGVFKFGRFISFLPQSVITGFVNALGIMIFISQLTHFKGESWLMYLIVAVTLAIIYLLPKLTKAIPSALVAIVVMTAAVIFLGLESNLKNVGSMGELPSTLPVFLLPDIPLNFETLMIILPFSLTLAVVGILESLLTATILDEMTDTKSNKNKEIRGQGIANTITGFFGGMAGCALIGQSVVNIRNGGRGRLSTFVAGAFLLFLIFVLGDMVNRVPMAALVGVMIMVAISTFDWQSIRELSKAPITDTLVMITTVTVVIFTNNLALGVLVGVILSALIFGWKIAKLSVQTKHQQHEKYYYIGGQLFFGTMQTFVDLFDHHNDPKRIIIDFSNSHIWDQSALTAISKTINKYEQLDKQVVITGMNKDSEALVNKLKLGS